MQEHMIDRLLDKTFCLHASTLFSVSRLFIRKQPFFISPPSLACINLPRIPHESENILYLKGVAPMPHPGITCSYTGPGARLSKVPIINGPGEGSFENEDRSTKHPNLENEDPKSRKRSTLNRKRSTQNSKTKTPKSRKQSTQNLKLLTLVVDTIERVVSWENCSIHTFSYLLFVKQFWKVVNR